MTTSPQARLTYSAIESDPNMLWATQFLAPEPFSSIKKRDKRFLVLSDLEMHHAKEQDSAGKVRNIRLTLEDTLLQWKPGFTNPEWKTWFEDPRFLKSGMLENILPHSLRGSH